MSKMIGYCPEDNYCWNCKKHYTTNAYDNSFPMCPHCEERKKIIKINIEKMKNGLKIDSFE